MGFKLTQKQSAHVIFVDSNMKARLFFDWKVKEYSNFLHQISSSGNRCLQAELEQTYLRFHCGQGNIYVCNFLTHKTGHVANVIMYPVQLRAQ